MAKTGGAGLDVVKTGRAGLDDAVSGDTNVTRGGEELEAFGQHRPAQHRPPGGRTWSSSCAEAQRLHIQTQHVMHPRATLP